MRVLPERSIACPKLAGEEEGTEPSLIALAQLQKGLLLARIQLLQKAVNLFAHVEPPLQPSVAFLFQDRTEGGPIILRFEKGEEHTALPFLALCFLAIELAPLLQGCSSLLKRLALLCIQSQRLDRLHLFVWCLDHNLHPLLGLPGTIEETSVHKEGNDEEDPGKAALHRIRVSFERRSLEKEVFLRQVEATDRALQSGYFHLLLDTSGRHPKLVAAIGTEDAKSHGRREG